MKHLGLRVGHQHCGVTRVTQDRIHMACTPVHEAAHRDSVRALPPACHDLSYTLDRDDANAFGPVVEQLVRERSTA
ncbi:MAG TPA: hypothetical protein VFL86_16650 [Burkholderiaceae bacterium]|nr:hypothetical protein [Burkholderiaceae bacterium]